MAHQLPPGTQWEPGQVPSLSTPEVINGDLPRSYYVQGADFTQLPLGYGGHAHWCCTLDGSLTTTAVPVLIYWPAFVTRARPGLLATGTGTAKITVGGSTYDVAIGGSDVDGSGSVYGNALVWWADGDYKLSGAGLDRPNISSGVKLSLDASAADVRVYAIVFEFGRHDSAL